MSNSTSTSNSFIDTNIITGLGNVATDTYNFFNGILSNPSVIIIVVGVLLIYITMFFSLGDTNSSTSSSSDGLFSGLTNAKFSSSTSSTTTTDTSSSMKYLGILGAAIFFILIVINGFQYFFGIDIVAKISDLFSGNPVVDISVDTTAAQSGSSTGAGSGTGAGAGAGTGAGAIEQIKLYPQVFNIPGNDYVYPDAKALCSAYGSRLATYKEVEDAYKGGAEWCNYGWSEGQMALFPTQQKTWDKLQTIEGHENDCGRPGINGGYMKNPAVKYGVNCYGYKPQMTAEEEELMATSPIYPKTKKDMAMEQRVKYWKDKLSSILVSPFNHTSWSKI
jgi:hypothetical protein